MAVADAFVPMIPMNSERSERREQKTSTGTWIHQDLSKKSKDFDMKTSSKALLRWRRKKGQRPLDQDFDHLRAISLLPAEELSGMDETFKALNEGLGFALSAHVARRQLSERLIKKGDATGRLALFRAVGQIKKLRQSPAEAACTYVNEASRKLAVIQTIAGAVKDSEKARLRLKEPVEADEADKADQGLRLGSAGSTEESIDEWAKQWLQKSPAGRLRATSGRLDEFHDRLQLRFRFGQAFRLNPSHVPLSIVPQPPQRKRPTSKGRPSSRPASRPGSRPGSKRKARGGDDGFQQPLLNDPAQTPGSTSCKLSREETRATAPVLPSLSAVKAKLGKDCDSFTTAGTQLPDLTPRAQHGGKVHSLKGSNVFRATRLPSTSAEESHELLRRAQPSHRAQDVAITETPEFAYIRACELAGLIPLPEAWLHFRDQGIIDASRGHLHDRDLVVLVETAVKYAAVGHPFRELVLSHNCLTDSGLDALAMLLEGSKLGQSDRSPVIDAINEGDPRSSCCSLLTTIKLAGNQSLKFKADGLTEAFGRALSSMPALSSLDFSGIQLKGKPAVSLAHLLATSCPGLRNLSLAGCGLGLLDQSDCVAVAALLGKGMESTSGAGVERADFSNNYFALEGYSAAASALAKGKSRLKRLCLAGNYSWHKKDMTSHALDSKLLGESPNPLQLLVEMLAFVVKLERLDIGNCLVGPDTAWVLEEALRDHRSLSYLCVEDNPLGEEGLRCMLRLLDNNEQLARVSIAGVREYTGPFKAKLAPVMPWGHYKLDLQFASERAVLRRLLSASERNLFRFGSRGLKFDQKLKHRDNSEVNQGALWLERTHGICSLHFHPTISDTCHKLKKETMQQNENAPKAKAKETEQTVGEDIPRFWRRYAIVPGAPAFKHDSSAADDVQGAATEVPSFWPPQQQQAFPGYSGTPEGDRAELMMLISQARRVWKLKKSWPLQQMFNDLEVESDRIRLGSAFSRDFTMTWGQLNALCSDIGTAWEQLSSRHLEVFIAFMNCRGEQMRFLSRLPSDTNVKLFLRQVDALLWFSPDNLTGHYSLDLSSPSDFVVAETCWLSCAWEAEVSKAAYRPDMSQRGNFETIRNQVHNKTPFGSAGDFVLPCSGLLSFDYSTVARPPPDILPMSSECVEVAAELKNSNLTETQQLHALRAVSVHMFLSARHASMLLRCFQTNENPGVFDSPESKSRQDAFCILHTRVVDRDNLLGPDAFYSASALYEAEEARTRKTVEAGPEKNQAEGTKAAAAAVSKTKHGKKEQAKPDFFATVNKARLAAAKDALQYMTKKKSEGSSILLHHLDQRELTRRLGVLHLMNPLRPEVAQIQCTLEDYENKRFLDFYLQLSTIEPGGEIRAWQDGHQVMVPASWKDAGAPLNNSSIVVSYESRTSNLMTRFTLADMYTIGFYGPHTGEMPMALAPLKAR
eukprot:TRINITY_DN62460_c0_g1_i1.p1 TRINITY_DN62460_c0_g1~~TRINITY_DN62460_c0_g1_i1.p1  ORF type:complete len:1431 (+),score=262.42 TRINITY_DN62460_c0_g1_i1:137-4429(+)